MCSACWQCHRHRRGFLLLSFTLMGACPSKPPHSLESYCDAKDDPSRRRLYERVVGTPFGVVHIQIAIPGLQRRYRVELVSEQTDDLIFELRAGTPSAHVTRSG